MFKPNDTVFVYKIGGISGRVVDYNPYTNEVRVLHRMRHNYWLQVKYNADLIRKSAYPVSWDMNTPFVTQKPTMLESLYSYLGFA
jgi:hypothetical protein